MEEQRPVEGDVGDVHFSSQSFAQAMSLVRSGSDTAANKGLAELRTMSGHMDAPLDALSVAVTEADAMPVLLRVLDLYPPDSEAIKNLTWLLVNLAVAPVGCTLLMAADVPVALGVFLSKNRTSVPVHVVDNACWVLSNLAGENFATMKELVENGSFQKILLPSLDHFFSGAVREDDEIYGTLSWALSNFCSGKIGHLPYPVLKPILPYLIWALDHLKGDHLLNIGWAVAHLFDDLRPGVEWSDFTDPERGILSQVMHILQDENCAGTEPKPFVLVMGQFSALDDTGSVFSPKLVSDLLDLIGHPPIRRRPACLLSLLWCLSNVAIDLQCVGTFLSHSGALTELIDASTGQLSGLEPGANLSPGVWTTASELASVLANLVDGTDEIYAEAARHLLAWRVPRWTAVILSAAPPNTSRAVVEAAFQTKQHAARVAALLVQQGPLEPDEAYSNGEDGPNPYFSEFAAASRLHMIMLKENVERDGPEKDFLGLAALLVGTHGSVKVQLAELKGDHGDRSDGNGEEGGDDGEEGHVGDSFSEGDSDDSDGEGGRIEDGDSDNDA